MGLSTLVFGGLVDPVALAVGVPSGFPIEQFLAHWWVFPASVLFAAVALATVGGFITGLISAGLSEVTTTQLIIRCRLPPRVAVATSVFVLAIAAVAGAAVHALAATPVWYIVAWSVPGVILGGTIGTRVGKYVPSEIMEPVLGGVFAMVGLIVLVSELLA